MSVCQTGKVIYGSRLSALFALVQIQRQDDPQHREKRVYRCPVCRRWHLTSQERRQHAYV